VPKQVHFIHFEYCVKIHTGKKVTVWSLSRLKCIDFFRVLSSNFYSTVMIGILVLEEDFAHFSFRCSIFPTQEITMIVRVKV
jgi:hypothetical protein